jgi:hypothetical protein
LIYYYVLYVFSSTGIFILFLFILYFYFFPMPRRHHHSRYTQPQHIILYHPYPFAFPFPLHLYLHLHLYIYIYIYIYINIVIAAELTLRLGAVNELRCIANCHDRGTCLSNGNCDCEEGWSSSSLNRPTSCEFQIEDLSFDMSRENTVRVGDWNFFKFTISELQAYGRTMLFELTSTSPHSQPILLVRRGAVS